MISKPRDPAELPAQPNICVENKCPKKVKEERVDEFHGPVMKLLVRNFGEGNPSRNMGLPSRINSLKVWPQTRKAKALLAKGHAQQRFLYAKIRKDNYRLYTTTE